MLSFSNAGLNNNFCSGQVQSIEQVNANCHLLYWTSEK